MEYLRLRFGQDDATSRQWYSLLILATAIISLWVISLFTLGFSLPIYLLAVGAVFIPIFLQPTIGLPLIILATMWFQTWFTLEPISIGDFTLKLYPLDVVFFFTVLGFAFHQAFGKEKRRFALKRPEIYLLLFILLCTVYLIVGFMNGEVDQALNVSAFKNYAFYALLYFLVLFSIQSFEELKRVLKVFLIGGWGLIVFVLIGILRGQGLWTEFNPLSTEGTRLLAFPHAFYLSLVLVMTLVFFVYKLRPERVTLLTMWIQLIGVLGSLMRHLWAALFAATVFLFILLPRKAKELLVQFLAKNAAMVALFVSVLAFIMFVFPLSSVTMQLQDVTDPVYRRAQSLTDAARDSSARWRFFAWRAGQESFVTSPFFGIGYGQELSIDFDTYRVVIPIRELHNSFLVLLVQMGVLGALVFLAFFWQFIRGGYRAWKGRGMLWPYQLAVGSAVALYVGAAFWQPYFEANFTGIFFWILLGLLTVSFRLDKEEVQI